MKNNQKELILLKDLGMLYPSETSKRKRRYGIFRCHCGNEFKTLFEKVKNGHIKSCGCLNKGKNKTQGLTKHRLYNTWKNMKRRCYSIKSKDYIRHGARGITVCNEWHNVENFINDMYPSYTEGLTLDRIDNSKGYSNDNCRWTSTVIQNRNTRVLRSNNTSGYRGASWCKRRNRFIALICVNSKQIYIGTFTSAIEAGKAYDKYILDNNLEHTRNLIID